MGPSRSSRVSRALLRLPDPAVANRRHNFNQDTCQQTAAVGVTGVYGTAVIISAVDA